MAKQKLAPKAPPQEVIDKRRNMVASLLARGMTQIEITNQLGAQYIIRDGQERPNPSYLINPITSEPFDKATINRDVQYLRKQWRENAEEVIEELLSKQLAEIREARRVAWARGDIEEVRLSIALEMKLTGTAKPERKEIKLDDNQFAAMQSAEERVREKISRIAVLLSQSGDDDTED